MLVTVEEAKTKRCQEGFAASKGVTVRAAEPPTQTYSQAHAVSTSGFGMAGAGVAMMATPEQGPTAPFFCLGPDCMAWKWSQTWDGTDSVNDRTIDGDRLGYCGKAR